MELVRINDDGATGRLGFTALGTLVCEAYRTRAAMVEGRSGPGETTMKVDGEDAEERRGVVTHIW